MNKIIKYYLLFLPIFSLLGILSSISRSVYQVSYVQEFLLISAFLDSLIIISGFKNLAKREIFIVLFLLMFSFIIGLYNNEISRRFITDFTNPFFFFAKVFIFSKYWNYNDFNKYIKFYTRISFIGSLVLLPMTYFLFNSTGTTRLAIFPPMEIPFANFMITNTMLLLVSFVIILLYGKRAQLISGILTFLIYIFIFRRKDFMKYALILSLSSIAITPILIRYSDNLAVNRLTSTFQMYLEDRDDKSSLDRLSAGRYTEFETIVNTMEFKDYIIGKGLGYTYNIDVGTELSETTNAHFSPIGLISKYGLFFTAFLYLFLLRIFFKTNKKLLRRMDYVVAIAVAIFIFFESFFAYALFVTPILPVVLGVLISYQKRKFINRSQMVTNSQYINDVN